MKKPSIRLEPHEDFKRALVGNPADLRYNYQLLVELMMDKDGLTEDDAVDWVEYNICGLEPMGLRISHARPTKKLAKKDA